MRIGLSTEKLVVLNGLKELLGLEQGTIIPLSQGPVVAGQFSLTFSGLLNIWAFIDFLQENVKSVNHLKI
jgi:hypothetical protein